MITFEYRRTSAIVEEVGAQGHRSKPVDEMSRLGLALEWELSYS